MGNVFLLYLSKRERKKINEESVRVRELWSTAPTLTHSAGAISRHQVTTDATFAAVGERRAGAGTSSMVFAIWSAVGPGAPSDHLKRQIKAWQRAKNKKNKQRKTYIFVMKPFKVEEPSKTRHRTIYVRSSTTN